MYILGILSGVLVGLGLIALAIKSAKKKVNKIEQDQEDRFNKN